MKINVEVDLNEFYAENVDSDGCVHSSLKEEIIDVVRSQVRESISKQVSEEVKILATQYYSDYAEQKMKAIVDFKFDEFIRSGMVAKNHFSSEMIPIEERLRAVFDNPNNWSAPIKKMEEVGKKFGEECRQRYDMAFASSIVKGLEKQGLLKPGVFDAITSQVD